MLSASTTALIMAGFLLIYVVVVPILDVKVKDYMSLRWAALVTLLALGVGATLDFSHLNDECRYVILLSVGITIPVWIALRTVEKLAIKGYVGKISVKKGDMSADLDLNESNESNQSNRRD